MSLKEIQDATHQAQLNDQLPSTIGECREAAQQMIVLAAQSDITPPRASHTVLVWPAENTDPTNTTIHYAFCATSTEGSLYINLIKAAGFPLFNQIANSPPGRLGRMVPVGEVV